MRIEGRDHRSLWPTRDGGALEAIDQTALPHRFVTRRIADLEGVVEAIRAMGHGGAGRAADRGE